MSELSLIMIYNCAWSMIDTTICDKTDIISRIIASKEVSNFLLHLLVLFIHSIVFE